MKKNLNRISNLILILMLGFFLFQRLPGILDHFRSQGSPAPTFNVPLLDGSTFNLEKRDQPLVVIFWATWCGPCEFELSRINKLVRTQKIAAESILAVSSFESAELVAKTAQSRDYRFPIGLDPLGKMAKDFKVAGTPTIVFITKDKKIEWISTGLSPALEFRLRSFLKGSKEESP